MEIYMNDYGKIVKKKEKEYLYMKMIKMILLV